MRRRRRIPELGHTGPDERWMASYLDMVTVLMCMFIVLFAMSSVDEEKFEALRSSLATGFGSDASEHKDVSEGVIVPEELLDEEGEGFAELEPNAAQAEYDSLSALRDSLQDALNARGAGDAATFTINDRGLTVGLISAETFFATNSTALSDKARTVLDAVGEVLTAVPHQISIEGHADNRAPSPPFTDNWHLSSERATGVLRHLVESGALPAARVSAVGYGASRPMAEGTSAEALAMNRRVDIVVLSEASEDIRNQLPGLAAGGQQ